MKSLMTSVKLLLLMTFLTGIAYPVLVTLVGQGIFRTQARGSLIQKDGHTIGSELIGQKFVNGRYFWGRPSAIDYNPVPSGGSNLAPTSKKLADSKLEQNNRFPGKEIPSDLLFASASGIDPHISLEAAEIQIDRVIVERKWDESRRASVVDLIRRNTAPRQMGFLGEKRVNVLALNLGLDDLR